MIQSSSRWFAAQSVIQPRALKLHQKSNRHLSQPFAEQRDDFGMIGTLGVDLDGDHATSQALHAAPPPRGSERLGRGVVTLITPGTTRRNRSGPVPWGC